MTSAWFSYRNQNQTVRIPLERRRTVFGRSPQCEVALPIRELSRQHFAVEWSADQWVITDLASRFGTFVNGTRVQSAVLADEDVVTVGTPDGASVLFVFRGAEARILEIQDSVIIDDGAAMPPVGAAIDVAGRWGEPRDGTSGGTSGTDTALRAQPGSAPVGGEPTDTGGLIRLFGQMGDALLSSHSLEALLQHVLDLAFGHIPAERGSICLCDAAGDRLVGKAARRGGTREPIHVSRRVADEVMKHRRALLVTDALEDARFQTSESLLGMGVRSVLCAPMYHHGQVLGLIYLDSATRGPADRCVFTPNHLDLLTAIAVFAAAGVDRARLKQDIQREQRLGEIAHSRIHVLLEVAQSLSSELNTEVLIQTIMVRARELVDAERCTLFLVDERAGELWSKLAEGTGEIRVPLDKGLAGHVATTGEVVNIADAYADARFNPEVDRRTGFRTRNILAMPLRNQQGTVVGVTQMINKRDGGAFSSEDEQLLHAFSAQAAVSLENAKLFQETLAMRNHLESVLKSITNLVLTLDSHGRLVTVNRSADSLLGISEESMRRLPCPEWFSGRNAGFVADVARVYAEAHPVYAADYAFERHGPPASANYSIVPLLNSERQQTGVVVVLDDITLEKRMRATLGRYMSPALAEQVLRSDQAPLGGVRQKVTVLFSDIRGYTSFTESMDATEVVELLNAYFGYMVDVVDAEQGVLDKFIGDAIMASFGVPFPRPDDAVRACQAALGMMRQLQLFNAQRAARGTAEIQIGIGINTGLVVSGNIGSEKRTDYTCIGDTVNLSSRLEGASKFYGVGILLSEFTQREIAANFVTRELDLIRVKGKQQAIRLFELLGTGADDVPRVLYESLPIWTRALNCYRDRDWSTAETLFEQVWTRCQDPAARLFLGRCRNFQLNPPPAEWDATWELTEK